MVSDMRWIAIIAKAVEPDEAADQSIEPVKAGVSLFN